MAKRIVFTDKQQVALESFEPGDAGPEEVRVRTLYSLMSTGTENIALNQLFSPGSHWASWIHYPFYPGYSAVGIVEEAGSQVSSLVVGDIVYLGLPHASHFVTRADACIPVPADVDPRLAVWQALASTAFVGARTAGYRVGSSLVIVGAGPIGQMSTRWAAAAGLDRIVVVDPFPWRLELAVTAGATAAVPGFVGERHAEIVTALGGRQPSVVIDGTGNAAVLAQALGIVAFRGRLVVLGDTGSPEAQHLTSDVITRGVTIVGAHGAHLGTVLGEDEVDDPFATFRPNAVVGPREPVEPRFARLFHRLISTGRFPLENLISHEFSAGECEQAYKVANEARDTTMGILFDWT